MSDWISNAKQKEEKARGEAQSREAASARQIERLALAFPEWQSLLYRELQRLCGELAKAFPDQLSRNYSVNVKAHGYLVQCQGLPEKSLDMEFIIPTQTMTVRRVERQNLHDAKRVVTSSGKIKITEDSTVFVEYTPLEAPSTAGGRYAQPEVLANDLMREITGL